MSAAHRNQKPAAGTAGLNERGNYLANSTTEIVPFDFYGDQIDVVRHENGSVSISLRRMCENLGLDVRSQLRKLQGKPWATMVMMTTVAEDGKSREMACLALRSVPMWLGNINVDKCAPEIRPKLIRYQCEAADVLADHFLGARTQSVAIEALSEEIDRRMYVLVEKHVDSRMRLMEMKLASMDLWPLGDYARSKKVTITPKEARLIATSLMAICRANGLRTGQQPAPIRFNTPIRTYPKSILDAHFESLVARYRPSANLTLFPVKPVEVVKGA